MAMARGRPPLPATLADTYPRARYRISGDDYLLARAYRPLAHAIAGARHQSKARAPSGDAGARARTSQRGRQHELRERDELPDNLAGLDLEPYAQHLHAEDIHTSRDLRPTTCGGDV